MCCDYRIAAASAPVGLPEVKLGLLPGAGGTQRLVRAVGKSVAMKMVLAGEFIDAKEAVRLGLAAEMTRIESTLEEREREEQLRYRRLLDRTDVGRRLS